MELSLFPDSKEDLHQYRMLYDSRDFESENNFELDDMTFELERNSEIDFPDGRRLAAIVLDPVGALSLAKQYRVLLDWERSTHREIVLFLGSERAMEFLLTHELSPVPMTHTLHHHHRTITIRTGDITRIETEAVVNASNTRLKLGAGVSGALKKAAGARLQEVMERAASDLHPGDVVMTPSLLPTCKWLLHAATADGNPETIQRALSNIFKLCREQRISSVAIPALGTGTGGLPMQRFARIFLDVLDEIGQEGAAPEDPREIQVVLFSYRSFTIFEFVETESGSVFS